MNRLLLAFAVLAASVFAHGQVELKDFLAARQQYGIKSSLTASVFRDFTGSGVFELRLPTSRVGTRTTRTSAARTLE